MFVVNDDVPELAESVILRVWNVTVLNTAEPVTSDLVSIDAADDMVEIVIAENDQARGVVSIAPLAQEADEADGSVAFALHRSRGVFGAVTVTAQLQSLAGTPGYGASEVASVAQAWHSCDAVLNW